MSVWIVESHGASLYMIHRDLWQVDPLRSAAHPYAETTHSPAGQAAKPFEGRRDVALWNYEIILCGAL